MLHGTNVQWSVVAPDPRIAAEENPTGPPLRRHAVARAAATMIGRSRRAWPAAVTWCA